MKGTIIVSEAPKNFNNNPNLSHVIDTPVRGGETQVQPDALPQYPAASPEGPEKKKSRKGLNITAGVLAGTLALGIGGKLGFDALTAPHDQDPATTGQDGGNTDGEGTDPTTGEVLPVYQFEADPLTVEQYPDATTLVPAFLNENSEWFNVGGNLENEEVWLNSNDGPTFAQNLLTESDNNYVSALVIDGYDPESPLGQWVALQEETHVNTLTLNFATTPGSELSNPADLEAYVRGVKLATDNPAEDIQTLSQTDTQLVAKVNVAGYDNSDKNRTVELTGGVEINTEAHPLVLTWSAVNGKWVLSNIVG